MRERTTSICAISDGTCSWNGATNTTRPSVHPPAVNNNHAHLFSKVLPMLRYELPRTTGSVPRHLSIKYHYGEQSNDVLLCGSMLESKDTFEVLGSVNKTERCEDNPPKHFTRQHEHDQSECGRLSTRRGFPILVGSENYVHKPSLMTTCYVQ